jgi:hypothetical protein
MRALFPLPINGHQLLLPPENSRKQRSRLLRKMAELGWWQCVAFVLSPSAIHKFSHTSYVICKEANSKEIYN